MLTATAFCHCHCEELRRLFRSFLQEPVRAKRRRKLTRWAIKEFRDSPFYYLLHSGYWQSKINWLWLPQFLFIATSFFSLLLQCQPLFSRRGAALEPYWSALKDRCGDSRRSASWSSLSNRKCFHSSSHSAAFSNMLSFYNSNRGSSSAFLHLPPRWLNVTLVGSTPMAAAALALACATGWRTEGTAGDNTTAGRFPLQE